MSKSWYLLCYRYGHGTRAIKNLEQLGVTCFSPSKSTSPFTRKTVTKPTTDKEHLFPPYLFVEFDPSEILISSIKCTAGVGSFVSFGHQIKPVKREIIDVLMKGESGNLSIRKVITDITSCKNKELRSTMFLSMLRDIENGNNISLSSTPQYQ
jgi:transcriptional antiterminator RfaH